VIGGRGDRRHFNNAFRAVRAYDVSANTWRSRAQLPLRLYGANGAVEINGKIYVSGGLTTYLDTLRGGWRASRLGSLYVYDPSTDKWTRRRDLPYTSAYGVSGAYGGQLYVANFCEHVAVCGDGELLRYDPSTNRWMILGRTPHSPAFAGAGFVDRKFYLVDMDGHLDIYDVATNRWSIGPLAPFFQKAFCPSTSATLQAKLYLVGCHESDDFSGVYPMLVYDPRSAAWSEAAAPPIPALGHWWNLTRVLVNGRPGLELIGGERPGNHAQFMP
jgi:galactose oxidase-like protein